MVAIEIELLSNRYHATPWGRAANEGEPEWPPSPWRLARAIASAAWRLGIADERQSMINELLATLAAPPRIRLPAAVAAHTRHYMPIDGGLKTTLVLDPFTRTDGSAIRFAWQDIDLSPDQSELLDLLLSTIGYFGRAEGPCLARRIEEFQEGTQDAIPLSQSGDADDGEVVQVLCLADHATIGDLSVSTASRHRSGLLNPPGGRFVSYLRPRGALNPPSPTFVAGAPRPVHALRFVLESAAPVPITDAIQFADRYRAAALRRANAASPETVALIRGRHAGAGPLLQGHGHCHYLVTDEDEDRRADHLTVWCPLGLGTEAIQALDVVTLHSWTLDRPVSLVLVDRFAEADAPIAGLFAASTIWESHTPFVPVRHPKHKAGTVTDSYEEQIVLELTRRAFPAPVQVEMVREHRPSWGSFRRERDRRRDDSTSAMGVRLTFNQPVRGPMALGRHSHFGMGLFLPR